MIERVKLSVLNAVLFLGLSLALDLLLILRWGLVGAAVAGSTAVAACSGSARSARFLGSCPMTAASCDPSPRGS
jgi:O-antigen/teichoic acid export membrane protein